MNSYRNWQKVCCLLCVTVEMRVCSVVWLCFFWLLPISYCAIFDFCGPCDPKQATKTDRNTFTHKTFTQILTVFLLRLPFLLSLTRVPDLLPLGQQGPSALDHSGGGLQRSTVHRHRTFPRADLCVPTHRSHSCGLGRRTGSLGCYD